jgi:hypothetical protein
MSLTTSSSEGGPSTIRGVSEPGDFEFQVPCTSIKPWLGQIRREGEYMAGELPGRRMKQYFKTVNDIITDLQRSGFRIEVLEPQVRTCQSFISVKVQLTPGVACSTRYIVSRRRNRLVSSTEFVLKMKPDFILTEHSVARGHLRTSGLMSSLVANSA